MLRPILTWPDPRLTEMCQPVVPSDEVRQLAADMLDTMYAAPGRGLAAPQIGQMLRMFVMDVAWKDGPAAPRVFLNPEILSRSDETSTMSEGCLSLPGLSLPVTRPAEVTLRWQDPDGSWHQERLTGMAAICAQHEYDHLDGILTLARTDPAALGQQRAGLEALRAAWACRGETADMPDPAGAASPVQTSASAAAAAADAPLHALRTAQDRTGGAQ